MSQGRPKAALELTAEEQQELSGFAASRSLAHALVARARVVLWSAEGHSNSEIAICLRWSKATVGKCRQWFIERRIRGLYDELRPGRPRSISDEKVATLLRRTLKTKPPAGTHWSVRQVAEVHRLSKSTVHRIFQTFAPLPCSRTQQNLQALYRSLLRGEGCATSWDARSNPGFDPASSS